MDNDFLSSLLQIVIILDVVGVVAYFVLAAIKPRRSESVDVERLPAARPQSDGTSRRRGWGGMPALGRLRSRFSHLLPRRARRPATSTSESLEAAFGRLHRVLNSYQEGLA